MVYFRKVIVSIIEEYTCLVVVHFLVTHQVLTVLAILELSSLLRAECFRILFIEVTKLELLKGHPIMVYLSSLIFLVTVYVESLLCRLYGQE